jgi:hypothetical protein
MGRLVSCLAGVLLVVALVAGCGGDDADDVVSAPGPTVATPSGDGAATPPATAGGEADDVPHDGAAVDGPDEEAATAFPDLEVVRVDDGSPFLLTELAGDGRAVLLWFWAPH